MSAMTCFNTNALVVIHSFIPHFAVFSSIVPGVLLRFQSQLGSQVLVLCFQLVQVLL